MLPSYIFRLMSIIATTMYMTLTVLFHAAYFITTTVPPANYSRENLDLFPDKQFNLLQSDLIRSDVVEDIVAHADSSTNRHCRGHYDIQKPATTLTFSESDKQYVSNLVSRILTFQRHQRLSNVPRNIAIYGHPARALFKLLPLANAYVPTRYANKEKKIGLTDILSPGSESNDSVSHFLELKRLAQLLAQINIFPALFNAVQSHHAGRHYHRQWSTSLADDKLLPEMIHSRGATLTPFSSRLPDLKSTAGVKGSNVSMRYGTGSQRDTFNSYPHVYSVNKPTQKSRRVRLDVGSHSKTYGNSKPMLGSSRRGEVTGVTSLSGPDQLLDLRLNLQGRRRIYNVRSTTPLNMRAYRRRWKRRAFGTRGFQLRRRIKGSKRVINDVFLPTEKYRYFDNVWVDAHAPHKPQTVSLSIVVHMSVDRGYERDLQAALKRGINSQEFTPFRKYVSPFGKFVKLKDDKPRDILQAFCDDILMSNTTAVFHLVNPFYHSRSWSRAKYVSNLLSALDIPVISWGPEYIGTTHKRESDNLELNISPTLNHQALAMLNVLRHYNWTDFSLVYTPSTGHDAFITSIRVLVSDMNRQSGLKGFKFNILDEVEIGNTSDVSTIVQNMKKLIRSETRIILLYCFQEDTINILEAASSVKLMTEEYLWFLAFEAINKNRLQVANKLPIGIFGLFYDYEEDEMRQAIHLAVNIWLKALQLSLQAFRGHDGQPRGFPWQIGNVQCQSSNSLKWADGPTFFKFLKNVTFGGVKFNELGQLIYRKIVILNVQPPLLDEEDRRWKQVGLSTPEGIQMQRITWPNGALTPPSGKPKRNFLQIVTREEPPFVEYRDLSQNGSCGHSSYLCHVYERDHRKLRLSDKTVERCCTGLSIEFLQRLSVALNFDFYLYEVEDNQWGSKDASGRWNGVVGDLMMGKADMAISAMTIDEDRSTVINFSLPYMETGITFIVAIREGAISATAFLEPYDLPSWCLILVCSVHVTGTSIFLFEWFSPYGLDHGKKLSSKHRFSLFRTFWLMWAMLFGAAVTTDTPRGVSGKFMSNIWALFALVFSASYTANLAAFMITKEEYYDLKGMQDWRLQKPNSLNPPFRFATIVNSTTENNIKKHNLTMYRYMKKFTQTSVDDAMKSLKSNQLHAFIYDANVLKYQEGKDKDCKLINVGNWFATTGYGVGFPVSSPWLERVNTVILNLQYEGEMGRLKEFWLTGACHMKRKKTTNTRGIGNGVSSSTLGILNFTSAFILLAAGTGLAVLTLVLEHLYFCFARKRLRSWDKKGCCALVSLSMGMSLSFQTSEYINKKANVKCKSPLCESQLWKAQFELKQARHEIQRLQSELARITLEGCNGSEWPYEPVCTDDLDRGYSTISRQKEYVCQSRNRGICREDKSVFDDEAGECLRCYWRGRCNPQQQPKCFL